MLIFASVHCQLSNAADPTADLLQAPSVVPADPPPQPQDRKNGSSAAQAAAIAAAAMQGVMCMMMMQQAKKDGSTMEMMMAMQECAQAAQSAANAAKNDDAKQGASDNTPKQASLQMPKSSPTPSPNSNDKNLLDSLLGSPSPSPDSPDSGSGDLASNSEDARPTPDCAPAEEHPQEPVGPEAAPPKPLPTIDKSKLGYDGGGTVANDGSSSGGSAFGALMGGGGRFDSAKTVSVEELAKGTGQAAGPGTSETAGKQAKAENADGAYGSSGDSESGAKAGESNFDGLLSQIMGGPPGEAGPQMGANADVVILPTKKNSGNSGKAAPNIFEYANWRYKKAAHEEGRIRVRAFNAAHLAKDGTTPPAAAGPSLVGNQNPTLAVVK